VRAAAPDDSGAAPPAPARGLQEVLEAARTANKLDFVAVLDPRGRVLAQHNGPPAGEGGYLRENPLVTDAVNQPQSGPQSGPRVEPPDAVEALGLTARASANNLERALFVEAAAPIMAGDAAQGVVLVGQLVNNDLGGDQARQQSIVNEIKETLYPTLREEGAAVVALDTTIVSTNLPMGARETVAVGRTVEDANGSLQTPSFNRQTFGEQDYVTSFVPINETSAATGTRQIGRIGVAIRESWFLAIVNRVKWTIVAVTVGALLLAVLGAVYAARRLTRPIVELTEAANRISLGELDVPINVASNDEIGTLGEALDRMRISLKQAIERLRKR
jgi:methyl-accepting chemotaxis protein